MFSGLLLSIILYGKSKENKHISFSWTITFLISQSFSDCCYLEYEAMASVDLFVQLSLQVETLSREDLASRLSLTVDAASVGPLLLSDSFITIMDVSFSDTY